MKIGVLLRYFSLSEHAEARKMAGVRKVVFYPLVGLVTLNQRLSGNLCGTVSDGGRVGFCENRIFNLLTGSNLTQIQRRSERSLCRPRGAKFLVVTARCGK